VYMVLLDVSNSLPSVLFLVAMIIVL
jgi:hypothetical protein